MGRILFLGCLLTMACAPVATRAEDLKLEARLIWGTNDDTPPPQECKKLDDETAKKLTNVFKWKHYYQISKVLTNVPSRGTARIQMSKVCEIEITELQGAKVEVSLFGKGKKVNKTVENFSKGSFFTLGGDDKNDTAWFVLVTQL
ncbi:MAG TPA: hypothetical protein VNO52_09690 [Methylomirabilota bacterium]|nr:hypothetical protein [Methylomirabilota bacterium]